MFTVVSRLTGTKPFVSYYYRISTTRYNDIRSHIIDCEACANNEVHAQCLILIRTHRIVLFNSRRQVAEIDINDAGRNHVAKAGRIPRGLRKHWSKLQKSTAQMHDYMCLGWSRFTCLWAAQCIQGNFESNRYNRVHRCFTQDDEETKKVRYYRRFRCQTTWIRLLSAISREYPGARVA